MTAVLMHPSSLRCSKMHILRGKIADGCKPDLTQCAVFAASLTANLQKSSLLSSDGMHNE